MRIGILHPGEMGAGIGSALVDAGHEVLWASEGRSQATRSRAEKAGLRDVESLADVTAHADMIISVCPPHAAVQMACLVAGYGGTYLDANAVAPPTAADIARLIGAGGGRYVDGGIIGGPPIPGRPSRIYLSGAGAQHLAECFAGANLECRVVSDHAGDASALKCAYAAWTKGTSALVLAIRRYARSEGVEEALVEEWSQSQPDLTKRVLTAANQAATKGWRWVGEMEEIAKAFEAVGLPGGFHTAAADIYRRAPHVEGAGADAATIERVLEALNLRLHR